MAQTYPCANVSDSEAHTKLRLSVWKTVAHTYPVDADNGKLLNQYQIISIYVLNVNVALYNRTSDLPFIYFVNIHSRTPTIAPAPSVCLFRERMLDKIFCSLWAHMADVLEKTWTAH